MKVEQIVEHEEDAMNANDGYLFTHALNDLRQVASGKNILLTPEKAAAIINECVRLQIREAKKHHENTDLRAELARIKPSWDDAPEWAMWLRAPFGIIWDWETVNRDDGAVAMKRIEPRETLERRPEGADDE